MTKKVMFWAVGAWMAWCGLAEPEAVTCARANTIGVAGRAVVVSLTAATEPSTVVDGRRVAAAVFSGAGQVSEAYLRSVVRTTAGEPLDESVVRDDVRRLLRTGKFLSVTYALENTDAGVVVTFQLMDRPRVQAIRVVGNSKFKDDKLLKLVPLSVGDPLDAFSAAEGRNALESFYHDEGYGNARVTYDAKRLEEQGELVYTVEEGLRVRVRKVLYEGNAAVSARQLSKQVQTKTHLWIFRDGRFDADTVESDAYAIQDYYRDLGYLDARASYRLDFSDDGRDVTVVFTISEGALYAIESISVEGNTVFKAAELLESMHLQTGGVMERPWLGKDTQAIKTLYGERGYIYAQAQGGWVFSETPGQVRLSFKIDEGDQIYVGRVVVRGNERTQDKVVRRAVELYPEEVFNLSEARAAEQRLLQTQIFGKATVSPVGSAGQTRDALVHVQESERAADLLFGVGVTSNSGLVGSFVIDIKNFDLFDYPRSFSEFIKLRSFHGAGQRLRLEVQPGTEVSRFRLDFSDPYFLDRPIKFGTSVYYFTRGRDAYEEQRLGASVSLGKRLQRGWFKGWFGELALRVENVNIEPQDILTAHEIREDRGGNLMTSARVSLVRDRTDSRFLPTQGDRLRLSWEQFGVLGGDHLFAKVTGSYTRHKTMYVDVQDRKSVFSLRGEASAIVGDAPVFESLYAGGIGSMRGFRFRGISPRSGLRGDDAIGGDLRLLLGGEYSFPLYGENVRGVVFSDMGTVGTDSSIDAWRLSVGVGVRMTIQFFGPVPLEFNLAAPVFSDEDDEEQAFSFFIGAVF